MNERIELYKEILELEPNSRVFFAYAKLLEKEHRTEEALQTLAKGLELHPDFLEARLYYIDLLVKNDKLENAHIHLHKLTDVFQNYSGFWYTWSKLAADDNISISSALGLLATLFNNPSLSFMQIMQAGIQAYAPDNKADHLERAAEISFASLMGMGKEKTEVKAEPANPIESIQSILASTSQPESDFKETIPQEDLSHVLIAEQVSDNIEQITESASNVGDEYFGNYPTAPSVPLIAEKNEYYDIDKENAKISTNTKSMANLLAEQGEIASAIAIYTNLLQEAKDENDFEDVEYLNARIKNLQNVLENAPVAPKAEVQSTSDVLNLSPRMHSVLDRLADRLERRAQAS